MSNSIDIKDKTVQALASMLCLIVSIVSFKGSYAISLSFLLISVALGYLSYNQFKSKEVKNEN